MRIALVVPGGVDRGGEYRVVPALLAFIARLSQQHQVTIIALVQEDKPASWELYGATVHNIGRPRPGARGLLKLLQLNRTHRFEIVHAFWSGTCGLIAALAGRLLRIPSIIHVAGGELAALPEISYGSALTWRGRLRERLVLRGVTQVTAASAPVLQALAAISVTGRRVPLGVDLRTWPSLAPRPRTQNGPARLIYIASLNAVKDQPTLLRTLQFLAQQGVDFHATIVGEDTRDGAAQSMAGELGLAERITFTGFLTQKQLRPLVEEAHILVVSSRHETGPLVVLEAAVAGVPTVGTAVGHITEWAPAAALCAPVGDWQALAGLIKSMLQDDRLRLRVAEAAQSHALREDADFTTQCFMSLYARLCGAQRRSSSRT